MALKTSAGGLGHQGREDREQTETLAISAVLFVLAIKWVYYKQI